jgi:hypothetical protein
MRMNKLWPYITMWMNFNSTNWNKNTQTKRLPTASFYFKHFLKWVILKIIMICLCVHIYVNKKMIPVETIPGLGGEDKGEWRKE